MWNLLSEDVKVATGINSFKRVETDSWRIHLSMATSHGD